MELPGLAACGHVTTVAGCKKCDCQRHLNGLLASGFLFSFFEVALMFLEIIFKNELQNDASRIPKHDFSGRNGLQPNLHLT